MAEEGSNPQGMDRRGLLRLGAVAAAGLLADKLSAAEPQAKPAPPRPTPKLGPWNPATAGAMPTRNLGRTGFQVGIFSLGGQAAIEQANNEAVAVPLIERAIDLGVNYLDTSARYGGPERWSEQYYGKVMPRRRKEVFLASKSHDRTRDGSLKLLEKSFELLRTDHLDLWQMHAISTMDDVDKVTAKGGALEAFLQAREQKLVRFLGITGHTDPAPLMELARRFPFDTILLTLNAADPHHLGFKQELLPLAVEREMGIIGMKIPSRGRLLSSWTPPSLESQARAPIKATRPGTLSMKEAMRYVLTLPVSTVIVGCDSIAQLEENVALARAFTPMNATQLAELERRAEPVHQQALWYRRWT
jgi:uncharacterized protein